MVRTSVVVCAVVLALAPLSSAGAHEVREAAGAQFVVGWLEEPAYIGLRNGVDLRVTRGGSPVTGLERTLQVEVVVGAQGTGERELRPVFGSPGEYVADLIPTAPGAYTFRVIGSIEGEEIDQAFSAGPGTFDEVRGTGEIAFPVAYPSNPELAEAIEVLRAEVSDLREAADADNSGTARLLAIVAIALGAGALVITLVRRPGR